MYFNFGLLLAMAAMRAFTAFTFSTCAQRAGLPAIEM
jgi:hypothetical protein